MAIDFCQLPIKFLAVPDLPEEKPLRSASFAIHATRGVIRDPNMRRKTMFVLVLAAMLFLFAGSTFLSPLLSPHEHPVWFILYWLVCAWITLTAILLALFDILAARAQARKAARILRDQIAAKETPDSPRSGGDE
jgi:protein-S-isoprenylcysteine O-methyltransferase Ste14